MMMPGDTMAPVPQPDQVEQRDKKESAEKQQADGQQDNPDALRKQIAQQRARNEKVEKTIAAEGGENAAERKTGPERLQELIRQQLQVKMQEQLGMNENTDFASRDTAQLLRDHAILQQSEAYVRSHTAESLAQAGSMDGPLKVAYEQYRKENPNDATAGGLQGADREAAATIMRDALLKTVQVAQGKVDAELDKRKVNAGQQREERENSGEQLVNVRSTPNDRDFNPGSRNAIREFRNAIQRASTPDGLTYNRLMFQGPQNDGDRAAVRKFNVLAKKFDDAIAHCNETGIPAGDKNARAQALRDYSADMLRNPVTNPETLPSFRDWISQNPDKMKQAAERAAKTAD